MKQLPRNIVAALVMMLAFGIIAGLFFVPIPDSNGEVALVILGVAIGWAGSVVNYFYGTSQGSSEKTDMINEKNKRF